MRTIGIALLTASLATAANAAGPMADQDICREYASLIQQVSDKTNSTLSRLSVNRVAKLPDGEFSVTPETLDRAVAAEDAWLAAMAEYRDAIDALAAEIRACRSRG